MSYKLLLTHEARQDESEGFNYYEDIRTGLGDEFLNTLSQHYSLISENPFLYSFTDSIKTLRDVKVIRFPYVIIFEIIADTVIVFAVHNTYKKPNI